MLYMSSVCTAYLMHAGERKRGRWQCRALALAGLFAVALLVSRLPVAAAATAADTALRHTRLLNTAPLLLSTAQPSPHEALVLRAHKGASLRLTTLYHEHAGLCNQHITLINLLSIALSAGVDVVVLPLALQRRRFHYLKDPVIWPVAGADTLWDVNAIRAFLSGHGILLDLRDTTVVQQSEVLLPEKHYFIGQKELGTMALSLHDDTRAHLRTLPPARLLELAALSGNVTLHIPK